jgi:hypothetical protein
MVVLYTKGGNLMEHAYDIIDKYKKDNYLTWQETAKDLEISKFTISKLKSIKNGSKENDLTPNLIKRLSKHSIFKDRDIIEFQKEE